MNKDEAVEVIKNYKHAYLFANIEEDERIYGGTNANWINISGDDKQPDTYHETFLLKPLGDGSDLWSGVAERYGIDCSFPATSLDQLVDDICDLYATEYSSFMPPSHMMKLLLRLTEAGLFIRQHEEKVIFGSIRMNFASNDFWLVHFGNFYVANDSHRLSGSESIICSRSIDTVIESLMAYYGNTGSTQP